MKNLFSLATVTVLFLFSATIFASDTQLIGKSEEFSCRFKGLENLYTDIKLISLSVSRTLTQDEQVSYQAEIKLDDEKKVIPVSIKTDEKPEDLIRSLKQNQQAFKAGKNSYFSPRAAAKFLEIENHYYDNVLNQTRSVKTFVFGTQDWYFELEEVYNFYDNDGNYLVTWGYSRFKGVYNFCIPEKK